MQIELMNKGRHEKYIRWLTFTDSEWLLKLWFCSENEIMEDSKYYEYRLVLLDNESNFIWFIKCTANTIDNYFSIKHIYIMKEHRKNGYAEKLIEQVIKYYKKLNCNKCILSVFGNNKKAISVYKRLWFKKMWKIKKNTKINWKWLDLIQMRKKIKLKKIRKIRKI